MPRKPRKPAATDGTHVFRTASGFCTVRIVEHPTHVHVVIGGRRLGPLSRREDREWERFMQPLIRPYENDPRPLWIDHADGSRKAFVGKLSSGMILVGVQESPHGNLSV